MFGTRAFGSIGRLWGTSRTGTKKKCRSMLRSSANTGSGIRRADLVGDSKKAELIFPPWHHPVPAFLKSSCAHPGTDRRELYHSPVCEGRPTRNSRQVILSR